MDRLLSYSAASIFPAKVLRKLTGLFNGGKLRPIHPQISLTNECNLDCDFCSCAGRRDGEYLPIEKAVEIIWALERCGTQAITITGGGEPLMHPDFEEFVNFVGRRHIKMGLVTNGYLLPKISPEAISQMTWCRVSASDDRNIPLLLEKVAEAARKSPRVDWAFSYVVTIDFDPEKLAEIIRTANDLKFTHVRVVADLVDLYNPPDMGEVMTEIRGMDVDDKLVIYQGRKKFTRGSAKCLISLIKPLIGSDGNVYPCCGVQYALMDSSLDFDSRMCMGEDIEKISIQQDYFDGSICDRCYYRQYNDALSHIISPLDHEEFV